MKLEINLLFKLAIVISFFTHLNLNAQNISGVVVDEERKPLEFVSIALMQPSDSLLVKYTSSDQKGKFEISSIKSDTYYLQVFLMTYQTNSSIIKIDQENITLDTIQLNRAVNELNEVVINAVVPIKIKTDTVAFNTKAFKVRQDDNVGELIKKLPGIEVEANGTVSAHGQQITKILVDGKEFFNNDPQIALQNLSADALESVEIIDESSDDARVSGIRDGQKHKVINLVLKKGKKFGFFGKAGGGYGTNDRYSANVDINSFTKKSQFAVFANLNNINNTGASIFNRDGTKGSAQNGYVTTGIAGANYNYEIKENFNFNFDYYYNYTENDQATKSNRTEFSNRGDFDSEIESANNSISNNHNVNFSLRDRSVSGAYLLVRGNFKSDDRSSDGASKTVYFDEEDNEDTSSDRINNSEDQRKNGNLTISYRKKLNSNGRNLRWHSNIYYNDFTDIDRQISENEYNLSEEQYYFKSTEKTLRESNNNGIRYNYSFRYQEPIVENHYVSITSTVNNENRNVDLLQSKLVDNSQEDIYEFDQDYYRQGYANSLGYNFSKNKFQLSLSANYDIKKQQLKVDDEILVSKDYYKWLPRGTFSYNYKKGNYVRFLYHQTLRLPNHYQLSPVINDFNPLRISYGNPDLTPSKLENLHLRFYTHSFKSANSFYISLKYTKTHNAIVSKRIFGKNKVRYSTFENFGSKYNFVGYTHFSRKINGAGLRYAIRLRGNLNDRTSIIGEVINTATTQEGIFGLSFSNIDKNIFDVTVGADLKTSTTSFTKEGQDDNSFLEQKYYTKFDWDISKAFNINTQFKYTLLSDKNFDSQKIPIWNMGIEYVFMKGKRGLVKFQVFDILDKDVGVRINNNSDYYEETFSENLGTYAMLSFNYSIKPKNKQRRKKSK